MIPQKQIKRFLNYNVISIPRHERERRKISIQLEKRLKAKDIGFYSVMQRMPQTEHMNNQEILNTKGVKETYFKSGKRHFTLLGH